MLFREVERTSVCGRFYKLAIDEEACQLFMLKLMPEHSIK